VKALAIGFAMDTRTVAVAPSVTVYSVSGSETRVSS